MATEMVERIVTALRDTAEKAMETRTVKSDATPADYMSFREGPARTHEEDKYSRDWIAGRLLGMADILAHFGDAALDKRGEG